jgi:cytochrome c oxidase assembly protein subunit 15
MMTSAFDANRTAVLRRLAGFAVVLTFGLIMLGAWVRLTDAGLGCPDWPGCYGKLSPVHASDHIARAVDAQGGEHGPVSHGQGLARNDPPLHRHLSGAGDPRDRRACLDPAPRRSCASRRCWRLTLVAVVILQGLFGKWTVTLLLKPAIVTGHLVGGMLTFSLLLWFWLRQRPPPNYIDAEPVAALLWPARWRWWRIALQIFLGGWVSTNYAALACTDLPTCQGQWWPPANFADGFHFVRELGQAPVTARIRCRCRR